MNELAQDTSITTDPAYKVRSTHVKFLQQLFLGIGGSTVFGLVGALAIHGTGLALPLVLGLSVLGLGCLYLGSKFLAESVQLDHEHQARQIELLNQKGKARDAQLQSELVLNASDAGKSTPFGFTRASEVTEDTLSAPEKKWTDTITPRAELSRSAAVANDDQSWSERAQAEQPQRMAARA